MAARVHSCRLRNMDKVLSSPPETEKRDVLAKRVKSDPQRVPTTRPDPDVARKFASALEAAMEHEELRPEPVADSDVIEQDAEAPNHDRHVDYDDVDLEIDVETLEESGPGRFLIQRNAELLGGLSSLKNEIELLRRIAESGKDTSADRIVRAIDRADVAAAARGRSVRWLLVLLVLLNVSLIALVAYALWPLPFVTQFLS